MEAFRSVAPVIEAFAREHDLLIERYRGGRAGWDLHFARRLGGEARISVSYRERTGHVLDVLAVWWLDDPQSRSRRLRSAKLGVFRRREATTTLRELLENALELIDGWKLDDLGAAHGPFPQPVEDVGSGVLGDRLTVR
jgi:hypothetical protein